MTYIKYIFAIDPGPEQSAYVIWDGEKISDKGIVPNETLLHRMILSDYPSGTHLVIEQIASMGMAVGKTVFETIFWTGRFFQAYRLIAERMPRSEIKMHLCGSMRAKDANIRQALIDLYEPNLKLRERPKGILKGLKKDEWAALALAVTWWNKAQVKE